jgi:SOS-response transcriptional repressor LexA
MNLDKNSIADRLRLFLNKYFNSMDEAAEYLETTGNTLRSSYLSGRSVPGPEFLLKLINKGLDVVWLLTGEGEEGKKLTVNEISEMGYDVKKIRTFPIVSQLSAGDVRVYFEDNGIENFITLPYSHSNCVALKVDGDSMSPKIDEGDLILIDFYADTKPGDIVAVRLKNGSQLLKRYLQSKSSFVFLYSDNNKYPPMVIHQKEVELIYKVVKIIKDV